VFGLDLPMLADTDRALAAALLRAKWWLAYGMLGAVGLHAAAALAHHYLLRDGVLASMAPSGLWRRRAGPAPPRARRGRGHGGGEGAGLTLGPPPGGAPGGLTRSARR
jgi:hypothetical protein